MFYGGVVVPAGARVLGSELEQGFITQSVTNSLNDAGAACLIILGTVLWVDTRRATWLRWPCWGLWWCLVLGLAALVPLHLLMDRQLDVDAHSVLDPRAFHRLHRLYLATSTAQWVASLALLGLTLKLWQTTDREAVRPVTRPRKNDDGEPS